KLPPEVKNAISDSNTFKLSRYNLATISGSSISIIDPLDNQKPQIVANGNKPWDIITVPEFNKMYISNFGDSTILVIDLKSLKVIKEINFDKTALITKLGISPAKDKIYVLNFGLNKISSVSTATDEINTNEIKLNNSARTFIVDNLGRLLLFNASGLVIQTDSGSVINSLDFKISFSYDKAIYSKQTNTLLLVPSSGNNLASYDLSSDKATEIQLKENIVSAAFNPSGDKIYALSASSLSILESGTMKVLRENIPINTTGANNMIFSPDGRRLFITSGSNVSIFDINNESMISEHLELNGPADNIIAWSNN
ncbi:MAG: hypothetical protein H7263_03665, partial [Candidatus Sericytochromatia bacterium]|nr:hypothetical protein [Candidatus Sericytochromatia bacterium]